MNAVTEHTIAQEAGGWLFRLKDDRSDDCRAEFSAWLQTSPQHVTEFLLATAMDVELGSLDAERRFDIEALLAQVAPNVMPLDWTRRERRKAIDWRRWAAGIGVAAAIAALAVLWLDSKTYRTDTGEQRVVKLDDGSVVQLNTRSRIAVRYSREARIVELLEGEALFDVAGKVARPFEVVSGATRVQAIGTQFNVYRRATGATVSVVEGRVKIMSDAPAPVVLDAGQQAAVQASGRIVKSNGPEVSRALAWRQRHLEFRSATVAEVTAEFNRYNRLQIRVADESIASRHMSGLFEADEPQSLLDFLSNEGGVRFEKRGEVVTLYARPQP